MNKVSAVTGILSLGVMVASGAIAQQRPSANPAMQRYLDCINGASHQQQDKQPQKSDKPSDKLVDSQAVIGSCSSQKQAFLQSDKGAKYVVTMVERHLKSREKR